MALLCSPALTSVAHAEASTPVRVGYFYNGDFMHKGDDGSYQGYDAEYYYMIEGYAGWDVQFVDYDSLSSAVAGLQRGEIDILSGMSKTDQRESEFLFSSQKMCTAHISVQTRADDDRFTVGDPATMTDLSCGILKGSNVVTLYESWCQANGLTPHVVEFDSIQDRNAALVSGQVDAVAGGSTVENAQKIAEFPGLDLFFMFNDGRADLKSQLDRAMGVIALSKPAFASDLYEKYFPASRNTSPSFSSSEKSYISSHQTIKVAVLSNDAPFSSVGADGTVAGILPEYFSHLSEVIGFDMQCVPYASKEECVAALAAGDVDVIGKYTYDVFDAHDLNLIQTNSFLSTDLVRITKAGTGSVESTAIPSCVSALASAEFARTGSTATVTTLDNGTDCFEALKSGSVDSVICSQAVATWLLNRNRSSDYVISAFDGVTWNICLALPSDSTGNVLRSIFDKTITVDNGYMDQLIAKDTLQDSADLAGVLDRVPVSLLVGLVAVFAVLLASAVAGLIVLSRHHQAERRLAVLQAENDVREASVAAESRANAARREFFGTVSHDMRTPLNGIMGFAGLALASDDPEVTHDYLRKIQASGALLSDLVDDTLMMSRIESGKFSISPTANDTYELAEEVTLPVRSMAQKKSIDFVDNSHDVPRRTVLVDRLAFQRILLNLLSNAVRFTPEGGTVSLDVRFDPADSPQPDTVFTVSDDGRGISADFLPHLFEPFAQENRAQAGTTGTGLGLAIVKSLVDAMGGTIEVKSEPDKGTAITVRLHLQEISDSEDWNRTHDVTDAFASRLAGKRVLVCEDNALNLEILRSMLEERGVEVVVAENGELGVKAFEDSPNGYFQAVLLDLRMPVMGGIEAARAIRGLDRLDASTVTILAVSADAYPEDVSACVEAGMNGHVSKPIKADELFRKLAASVS